MRNKKGRKPQLRPSNMPPRGVEIACHRFLTTVLWPRSVTRTARSVHLAGASFQRACSSRPFGVGISGRRSLRPPGRSVPTDVGLSFGSESGSAGPQPPHYEYPHLDWLTRSAPDPLRATQEYAIMSLDEPRAVILAWQRQHLRLQLCNTRNHPLHLPHRRQRPRAWHLA